MGKRLRASDEGVLDVASTRQAGAAPMQSVPISLLDASPRNPRRDSADVAELADSMRAHGLLQPIVVRPLNDRFEIVAGHRRVEAARQLGWTDIQAVVRQDSEDAAYLLT